jgi:hypothetical protein
MQGRPWPALPSQADDGAVCVAVSLLPRQQQEAPAAASTATALAGSAGSITDKQQQQLEQPQAEADLAIEVAATAASIGKPAEQADSSSKAAEGAAAAAARVVSPCGDADDGLCTICYDNEASCVFMECGHGGYCWRCAHVLFARPPSECPVCRQPIQQVVELEDPAGALVGGAVRVKAQPGARSSSGSGASSGNKGAGGSWFKP